MFFSGANSGKITRLVLAVCTAASGWIAAPAWSITLEEAMVAAYHNNPALHSRRAAFRRSQEQLNQSYSGFRPNISGSYEYGHESLEVDSGGKTSSTPDSWQVQANQEIFSGFGTWHAVRAAGKRKDAAWADLLSTEQEILLEAATSYMNVLHDQSLLNLAKHNFDVLAKQLEAAHERFNVGEVTRTDVAQAEARVSIARTERITAKGNLVSSKARFKQVTGLEITSVVTPLLQYNDLPASLDNAVAIALQRNPLMQSADLQAEGAEKDVGVARSSFFPSVSVTGGIREFNNSLTVTGDEYRTDELKLSVSVPLYTAGSRFSRFRDAKQEALRSKYNAQDQRNRAVESVYRAWESLQTAQATIASTREAIRAAELALDGVKQEAKYGARTTLDVLDAEQELFAARVGLVRAQRDEFVAVYNLRALLGNLTADTLGLDVEPGLKPTQDQHWLRRATGF